MYNMRATEEHLLVIISELQQLHRIVGINGCFSGVYLKMVSERIGREETLCACKTTK